MAKYAAGVTNFLWQDWSKKQPGLVNLWSRWDWSNVSAGMEVWSKVLGRVKGWFIVSAGLGWLVKSVCRRGRVGQECLQSEGSGLGWLQEWKG